MGNVRSFFQETPFTVASPLVLSHTGGYGFHNGDASFRLDASRIAYLVKPYSQLPGYISSHYIWTAMIFPKKRRSQTFLIHGRG
jgi:hypothetical protein